MKQSIFEELFQKRVGTVKPGLERMKRALDKIKDPVWDDQGYTILVGGTNGKGGTSSLLWALLRSGLKGNKKVGLFTSPHLVSYRERFSISGQSTQDQDIIDIWEKLKFQLGSLYEELSFFELSTLIAYRLFSAHNVYIRIYEVGLGGRLDSTNALDPNITIITSISRDHETYLGHDLLGILQEKLGICRQGVPLYWGNGGEIVKEPSCSPYMNEFCHKEKIPLTIYGDDFALNGFGLQLTDQLRCCLPDLFLSSPDYIQKNFALACQVYHDIQKSHYEMSKLHDVLADLPANPANAPALVGRFQRIYIHDVKVIVDVCHNPDGLAHFIANLRSFNLQPVALVSILNDKDYGTMLDMMQNFFTDMIFFGIDSERAVEPKNLDRRHQHIKYAKNFAAAFDLGKSMWLDLPQPWVICGSVLAVGKVFESIEKDPLQFTYNDILRGQWTMGVR